MTVRQLTERAIVHWQRFNVRPDEVVRFVQPNEMAIILNRVTGGDPSRILGKLQANGQLFLVNPNGILFGPKSRVDVGSLVATTLSLSNEDFLSGNYRFVQERNLELASVINHGQLRVTDEGYVVLAAPLVSNEGLIVANLGKVTLGAGQEVTLNLDGRNLVSYELGTARVEGGTVLLSPAQVSEGLTRVVQAANLVEENGHVRLIQGDGLLLQSGQVRGASVSMESTQTTVLGRGSVTSARGGGEVNVWGPNVRIDGLVDVTGGGRALLGGGLRGEGAPQNARSTHISSTAVVNADGAERGGTIVVWSESATSVSGALSARGEDGGFIETSSRRDLTVTGSVDASPRGGAPGEWLLDPANIILDDPGVTPPTTNVISTTAIASALSSGVNVTINAQTPSSDVGTVGDNPPDVGNITLKSTGTIAASGSSPAALTLTAGTSAGSIILNGDISGSGVALSLQPGTSGSVAVNGALDVATFQSTGGQGFSQGAGSTIRAANDFRVEQNTGSFSQSSNNTTSIQVTGGNARIIGTGDISLSQLDVSEFALLSGRTVVESGSDSQADIVAGSDARIDGAQGIGAAGNPLEINTSMVSAVAGSGDINLTSTAGDIYLFEVVTPGNVNVRVIGGSALVGRVWSSGRVALSASGSVKPAEVNPNEEIIGTDLTLTAGGAVDLDTDLSGTLRALVTGAGTLILNEVNGDFHVTSAIANNGAVRLSADNGDLLVHSASAGGAARNVTLTALAGDVRVGDVLAHDDSVLITSSGSIDELGADTLADVTARRVGLVSETGIGTVDRLEIDAATVTNATVNQNGPINLLDTAGGVLISNATTLNGAIRLHAAGGSLTITNGSAGGTGQNFTAITTGSGDILASNISALGDLIVLSSAASILEGGADGDPDLVATQLNLTAVSGIGAARATLETAADRLNATVSGPGKILVSEQDDLQVVSATTSNGLINIQANGPMTLERVIAGGSGSIVVETPDAGSILIGELAAGGNITLTASGSIDEQIADGAIDLNCPTGTLTLSSANAIGESSALEIDATNLSASASGPILAVRDLSGVGTQLNVTAVNYAGSINIVSAGGNLRADDIRATQPGSGINLTTSTMGSILVDFISANRTVNLRAAQNITEVGVDPEIDIIIHVGSSTVPYPLFQATQGVISTGDPLEIQLNSRLNVWTGGQIGGASIRLNGLMGPLTNPAGLIFKLNTPPGTCIFNEFTF